MLLLTWFKNMIKKAIYNNFSLVSYFFINIVVCNVAFQKHSCSLVLSFKLRVVCVGKQHFQSSFSNTGADDVHRLQDHWPRGIPGQQGKTFSYIKTWEMRLSQIWEGAYLKQCRKYFFLSRAISIFNISFELCSMQFLFCLKSNQFFLFNALQSECD